MQIRKYKDSDSDVIWRLFFNTVHSVNAKDYTPEQLDAWAAAADTDALMWAKRNLGENTIVAVFDGKIVGFGDIDKLGYLDHLFVDKDNVGKGVGAMICDELEKRCSSKVITTYASITARSFFEKRGYQVVRENEAVRHGVALKNYLMIKENN